ncbi:MAG TPA: type 1 glutamine amidotransferase [Acidimicrobiales bacterium]
MTTIAVIQHEDGCPLGLLDAWLTGAGATLRVHRPYAGEPLPDAGDADGLIVLGGSMGAMGDDERHPWLPATRDLLAAAVDRSVPTLAVCLGHQLLVAACGGQVGRNPAGKQMGLLPVGLTSESVGERLFANVTEGSRAVQWNNDIALELPEGTAILAETPDGVPQAIRIGEAAWGIQFHPEVDADMVAAWAADERPRPGASEAIEAIRAAAGELEATWRRFAERYVNLTERGL